MELDTEVLLVDADATASGACSSGSGCRPRRACSTCLSNPDLSIDSVVLSTNVDRLSVLPAGTPQAQSTELLASDAHEPPRRPAGRRTTRDGSSCSTRRRCWRASESRVLAAHMGQVIVVDRGGRYAAGNGCRGARDRGELPRGVHAAQPGVARRPRPLLRIVRLLRPLRAGAQRNPHAPSAAQGPRPPSKPRDRGAGLQTGRARDRGVHAARGGAVTADWRGIPDRTSTFDDCGAAARNPGMGDRDEFYRPGHADQQCQLW